MSVGRNRFDIRKFDEKMFEGKTSHEIEKMKYLNAFDYGTNLNFNQYGEGNQGLTAQDFFEGRNVKSLLDVGAGQGVFVNNMVDLYESLEKIYALDIASVSAGVNIENEKITWIEAYSHDIPLEDNQVEWITSMDCLEHILPEDVQTTCDEFYRVCSVGILVKIGYRDCQERSQLYEFLPEGHKSLHLSIFTKETWIEHFMDAGFKKYEMYKEDIKEPRRDNYLVFYK